MLIDDILWHTALRKAENPTPAMRARMTRATKFVLRQDFAIAADELSLDYPSLDKAVKLARLPYPECWLEVAQQDRKSFSNSACKEDTLPIRRLGWLLTQTDNSGAWKAEMLWVFVEPADDGGPLISTSPLAVEIDTRADTLARAISWNIASDLSPSAYAAARSESPSHWLPDWPGEYEYVIAVLALLNSKNVVELAPTDFAQKNKRRVKDGKPPLFDHYTIGIPGRYKMRHVSDGAQGRELRAHFVRGHFKVRRTGVFFWSAYRRGNLAHGFVHKNYVLRLGE
jgi:hypothetical protein